MKLSYQHLKQKIHSKPNINELSDKLFQLGHEHEIYDDIYDFEFTPNRGDCLSINGLLRDLKLFYDISISNDIFNDPINTLSFNFKNNVKKYCSNISFLRIEVDELPQKYNGELKEYFDDMDVKKNNFFTDISNYISYETGQPTHCYDELKLGNSIKLDFIDKKTTFETLLGKIIELNKGDLVFFNENHDVINLAGIVGGMNTACSENTRSVILECAYFDPEAIIGKSVLYDIRSDASHKFERNTDPACHEYVLRRFLRIVEKHTNINKIELFSDSNAQEKIIIPYKIDKINSVLGTNIKKSICSEILKKLGFLIYEDSIEVPSYRHDVENLNDISEEIARAIGFDNIKSTNFKIAFNKDNRTFNQEDKLKNLLTENGFYEVINNPFTSENDKDAIEIDNPLDSSRKFLRQNLKNSLINNLLYNERRQQDSLKLFEISNVYSSSSNTIKRLIGIIASGRIDRNYKDFSKFIDKKYISSIFEGVINLNQLYMEDIARESLDTKLKHPITYIEFALDSSVKINYSAESSKDLTIDNFKYSPVSDFPNSTRDLSYSVKDPAQFKLLEKRIYEFRDKLLREVFIFDYFHNEKQSEIKIGFRFVFQSNEKTITENEVKDVIDQIINDTVSIDSVSIPGLK